MFSEDGSTYIFSIGRLVWLFISPLQCTVWICPSLLPASHHIPHSWKLAVLSRVGHICPFHCVWSYVCVECGGGLDTLSTQVNTLEGICKLSHNQWIKDMYPGRKMGKCLNEKKIFGNYEYLSHHMGFKRGQKINYWVLETTCDIAELWLLLNAHQMFLLDSAEGGLLKSCWKAGPGSNPGGQKLKCKGLNMIKYVFDTLEENSVIQDECGYDSRNRAQTWEYF